MKARNKIVSLLLTLCLMMSILPTAAFAANEGIHVALGDSISTGYDVAVEERFTHLVAEHYGLTEDNHAVNGSTATDLIAMLNTGELDETLASASLITLTAGGNEMVDILCDRIANIYNASNSVKITGDDVVPTLNTLSGTAKVLWAARYVVPAISGSKSTGAPSFSNTDEFKAGLATYEKDLTASLKYIREKNPHAQVVVCTQFTPFKQLQNMSLFKQAYAEVDKAAQMLNKVITENASVLNYTVADIYPLFRDSKESLFPGDDNTDITSLSLTNVHPNPTGHALIAQTIIDLKLTITPPPSTEPLPFEPGVPAVYYTEADVSLSEGTVKVALNAMDGAMSVSAAFYNSDGKMVGIDYEVPAADASEITLSASLIGDAASVRVFLMNGAFAPVGSVLTPAA